MSNNGYSSELSGYNSNNSTNLKKIYKLERNINRLLKNASGKPYGYNSSEEFGQRMNSLTRPLEILRRRRQTRNVSRSTSPISSRPSSPSTRRNRRKTRKTRK